ncbi:MAG: Gldg family protein [Planctomycetota bacterium]|jgi:hypothetical protein
MKSTLARVVINLMLAAFVCAAVIGHLDLWRLWIVDGDSVVPNLRLVAPLLGAVGLFFLWVLLHVSEIHRFVTSERAVTALNSLLMVFATLMVAAFALLISERRYARIDFTAQRTYSIGERTRHVLSRLPGELHVYIFIGEARPFAATVRGMLDTYAAESQGRLQVHDLDPGRDLARFRDNLLGLGIDPRDLIEPDVVLFATTPGEGGIARTRIVPLRDLIEVAAPPGEDPQSSQPPAFRGEEEFTRAVLALAREEAPIVRFLSGHGELDLAGGLPDRNLKNFDRALGALDYEVEAFRFDLAAPAVPEETTVLVIAGPQTTLRAPEVDAVRRYLLRGGRALVLLEPIPTREPGTGVFFEKSGLEELLADWGITPEQAQLRDEATLLPILGDWSLQTPLQRADGGTHPITEPLARRGLWLAAQRALPLSVSHPRAPQNELRERAALSIVETLPSAKAVRASGLVSGEAGEAAGEDPGFSLVAVARETGPDEIEARIVCVGDASIAADHLTAPSRRLGNLNFLVNSIGWLAEREETISVQSKAPQVIRLHLDRDQVRRLWLLCLLELPIALLGLGLVTWGVRRG